MTHRLLVTLAFIAFAAPLWAQIDLLRLEGTYGVPDDPIWSCEANPATLSIIPSPPHLVFDFARPAEIYDGRTTSRTVYDLRDVTDTGIVARLEGETRLTDDGDVVVWILRPWPDYDGFCWGRTDWPLLNCVAPHIRCQDNAPTS